eukprot:TCONS_00003235-protein
MDPNHVSSVIKEYRVTLPMSVEEYRIGQLYGVAEASKNETGRGEGIEVVTNEPREEVIPGERSGATMKCQYTYKIFHLSSKVPTFIRSLAPTGSLEIHEQSWNAYPYCRTVYSNHYMKDRFHIVIETRHEPGTGDIDNVHNLPANQLNKRVVEKIDIVNDPCRQVDDKEEEDPTKFKSEKTGRGPIQGSGWEQTQDPVMTCYKLYHIEFQWFGLQGKVESVIVKTVRRLLFNFNRQMFCWIDKWHSMTIEDIRALEDQTKEDLGNMRSNGEVRGMRER